MSDASLEAAIGRVLSRRLPGFEELLAAERLSGGASQETYRLRVRAAGRERLLCLRRAAGGGVAETPAGRPGLAVEARLFRAARGAGVPEPEVLAVLDAADGLGAGFLMEWLDGETLGARIARDPELEGVRPRLAEQCGEILARIHAIDLEATGLGASLARIPPAEFVEQTWASYRALDTPQPMIDYAARWLEEHLPGDFEEALVHNDFRSGNLMVSPDGIVAVLDWELAHVGDPMRDLGWICTNSWRYGRSELPVGGFGRREDLYAGYEAVSGRPVDPERVRFWEIFGSFWWAVGCLGMAEHSRSGPDPSVERTAIGRRSSECQIDCANLLIPGPVELVDPVPLRGDGDMPRTDELLASVRDFLRRDVMTGTGGRTRFLSRVAANSLEIVLRDLARGGAHRDAEKARLEALLGPGGDLEALRWRLVRGLRDRSIPLGAPGLAAHLRQTVANQLAIDQPRYSGLRTATAGGPSPASNRESRPLRAAPDRRGDR